VNHRDETKATFADQTSKHDKRTAGRTDAAHTQLEIRSGGEPLEDGLREWIFERVGRQLGKFAPQIERLQVRFGDENGPKGGEDQCCMVHVILSKLPPVIVECRAASQREAFDLAAGRAERATRRNMEKHGVATHVQQHSQHADAETSALEENDVEPAAADAVIQDSLLGRRGAPLAGVVMADAASGMVDGEAVDHTVMRNLKQNTDGMPYRLEDSTTGKPSRKSTRGGANHIKHGNPLTQRTKAAVQGPKETAIRASVQKS
jgi:hypothetical protein